MVATKRDPDVVLEENLNLRNLLDAQQADEINAGVGEIVNEMWLSLMKVIKSGVKNPSVIQQAVNGIAEKYLPRIESYVDEALDVYTIDSFERLWDSWSSAMPDTYWWFYH